MSDVFDPPSGDAGALAGAARTFGTTSAQMTTDAGTVKSAIATAVALWHGTRSTDFQTASFGIQVELEAVISASGTVSQLLSAYAKQFTSTCETLAGLKRQYDSIEQNADALARSLPPTQSDQQDTIYQHAARQQGLLVNEALLAKSSLNSLGSKLAAAIDAETDSILPGGSSVPLDEIGRRVDAAYGVIGLQGQAAAGTLTTAQAWSMMAPAMAAAEKILDIVEDNKDGELPGGPVTTLTTDPAILQALLDDARADGIPPVRYSALLAQYWAVKAAVAAGIDLNGWDPAAGTDGNRATISAVYTFYGQLFLNNPNLTWAGMANMIGPSFAAGFLDINMFKDLAGALGGQLNKVPSWLRGALPPELQAMGAVSNMSAAEFQWFEQKFLAMQKHIFFDQASMHEAYVNGGTAAIDEMYAAGLIDGPADQAWQLIDSGTPANVAAGNKLLLSREQNQIINKQYDDMRNHDGPIGEGMTYLMTVIGSASIPGTKTPAQYSPLTISASVTVEPFPFVHETVDGSLSLPLPDFNITDKNARWDYVTNDTLPAYQKLLADNPDEVRQIVASSVDSRIEQQRLANRWPQLVKNLLEDWNISVGGGVSIGFP